MSTPTTGNIVATANGRTARFNGARWALVKAADDSAWERQYAREWIERLNGHTPRFTGQHIPAALAAKRVLAWVSPEAVIVTEEWDKWPGGAPAPANLVD